MARPPRRPVAFAAALLAAAAATALSAAEQAPDRGEADPRAAEVAARVMAALGGERAWAETRFIAFHFAGRRSHVWDRWTGRHRVEGTTAEGEPYVVLENVDSGVGRAWVGGRPLGDERGADMVKNAYAAWVNDTYWLLAPYKLRDPGAVLRYDGEEIVDGVVHDRLALSFARVGLTPGDRYWLWIDRATGLMDRWAYVLEDQPADAEPTVWRWLGWQRYGEIMLAPVRERVGAERRMDFSPIAVLETVPDSVFTSPEPPAGLPPAGGAPGDR